MRMLAVIAGASMLTLAACREEAAAPPEPVDMTTEALSYFCQMNISEHPGPKGQIHLSGHPAPLFFAQVRDLVAYLKSPERDAEIAAAFVTDMGLAVSWKQTGSGNWIDAETALFVVGAGVQGGMGAPEIVPFGDQASADIFIARFGGKAVPLDDIPDDAALGPVDLDAELEEPA